MHSPLCGVSIEVQTDDMEVSALLHMFSKTSSQSHQPTRIPRYELLGASNRIILAVRGESSVRTKFHNVPVELPPPPSVPNQSIIHEHSYCNNSNK